MKKLTFTQVNTLHIQLRKTALAAIRQIIRNAGGKIDLNPLREQYDLPYADIFEENHYSFGDIMELQLGKREHKNTIAILIYDINTSEDTIEELHTQHTTTIIDLWHYLISPSIKKYLRYHKAANQLINNQ